CAEARFRLSNDRGRCSGRPSHPFLRSRIRVMFGGMSIWHWLIVLLVVALIFGTKKLRNVGEDLGSAIKSFRKGMQDGDSQAQLKADPPPAPGAGTTSGENKSERVDS